MPLCVDTSGRTDEKQQGVLKMGANTHNYDHYTYRDGKGIRQKTMMYLFDAIKW